uniref:DUF4158 domain-containing protein n=1 Tax=Panagrellus redivivus TaxID=6233 RepID=A0A7E4W988_PANRE
MRPTYQFDAHDWFNHFSLTTDEKAVLRGKMEGFNKDGVADMIKIVQKHEKYIHVTPPTAESLLGLFESFRPVTHREIAAYIAVTPNKRKPTGARALQKPLISPRMTFKFRRSQPPNNASLNRHYPANNASLTAIDEADLRSKIAGFNKHGILDMQKIIDKHQDGVQLEMLSAECLLFHFEELHLTTLYAISGYITATPNKRRKIAARV